MYTKVPKMTTFGVLAIMIHVWMISAKGIKLNDKTVSVYSLSLYNFDQNKSFIRGYPIQWMNLVLSVWGHSKHTPGESQIVKITKETLQH